MAWDTCGSPPVTALDLPLDLLGLPFDARITHGDGACGKGQHRAVTGSSFQGPDSNIGGPITPVSLTDAFSGTVGIDNCTEDQQPPVQDPS